MTESVHQQLLSLLQLARRAREATTVEALGFIMVNETLQTLDYRQAILWGKREFPKGLNQVVAVSGLPQPNPNAAYTQWLNRFFGSMGEIDRNQAVRPLCAIDIPELGHEWGEWLPAHGLWIPLLHGDTEPAGTLMLVRDKEWQPRDLAVAEEIASSYAYALRALVQKNNTGSWLRNTLKRRSWRRWLWFTPLVIACIPVQPSVLAQAEVVPQNAFLVRAPQDGVIERVLVRPNQTVTPGTALFSLDQTALQTRQIVASKALDTAQEEFRQTLQIALTDDKGKLEMLLKRGVLQEKRVELGYLNELMGRIQVRSDRSGIAVFSDINELQGKTVQLGEKILTLADPNKVEISIWLPVGEHLDVMLGTTASLYPNASPLQSYEAKITQVAYSSELTRDGQLAYRLKAEFLPTQQLARIGLMGTVRLHGKRVPLLYHALRRPLTTVRQWLGL